jgi:endonuclease YncB( thermonuclease family)
MMGKPLPKNRGFTVLLIIVAVAIWGYQQLHPAAGKQRGNGSPASPAAVPKNRSPGAKSSQSVTKAGDYEFYQSCTLVEARNNDGDSFMLKLPDGRQAEFRLYFVDTPESAFKSYRGGETNRQRINEQAAELGGITAEQAVEIGQKGKHFTLDLLASRPFDIYTRWDSPFHDDRFHAFVSVQQGGKSRWLDELLVERGLVRIHTKPADLPDGTSAADQKSHLKDLERTAKRSQTGVWGL